MPAPASGLVLYASRYGSTAEAAREIAARAGARCLDVAAAGEADVRAAPFVVLGAPIYGHSILPEMERFLEGHGASLRGKPVGAFVVCIDTEEIAGTREGGGRNLAKLTRLLPEPPVATAVLGGRMRIADLNPGDLARIEGFARRIGREPKDSDRIDPARSAAFADRLLEALRGR